jgi:hypothetical protein
MEAGQQKLVIIMTDIRDAQVARFGVATEWYCTKNRSAPRCRQIYPNLILIALDWTGICTLQRLPNRLLSTPPSLDPLITLNGRHRTQFFFQSTR